MKVKMDVVYHEQVLDELRKNDIDIEEATFLFYIHKARDKFMFVVPEHITHEDLLTIWRVMVPCNFGRVMAFLALLCCVGVSEDIRRSVVRVTVPTLRNIDVKMYQRAQNKWVRFGKTVNHMFSSIKRRFMHE